MHTPINKITKINIDVCTVCNHRCTFCSNPDSRMLQATLDAEDFSHVAADIAKHVTVEELGLSAKGEPLLNRDLPAIIRMGKEIIGAKYIYISTNGALLTPDTLQTLLDAGLDSIKISLNAFTRETYRERHGRDDFEAVMANLRHALDLKKERIFKILISSVSEERPSLIHAHLLDLLGAERLERLNAAWQYDYCYTPHFEAPPRPGRLDPCPLPFTEIYINANLDLTPCCVDYFGELPLGNLKRKSIAELWEGEAIATLRKSLLKDSLPNEHLCVRCLSYSYRTKGKEDIRATPVERLRDQ